MRKKLNLLFSALLIFTLCIFSAGCLDDIELSEDVPQAELSLKKNSDMVKINTKNMSFDGLTPEKKKPFTLMVYMNGTDLESEGGCATEDLKEIAGAAVDSDKINILVLTGGTSAWNNDVIDSKKTMVYSMHGGEMREEATMGKALISEPNTLTAMINYSMNAFPAEHYGLIFWNHGGGPIFGYGSDEKAKGDDASLSITEIRSALANSMLANQKAEFIGFDACLMATVETADLIQNYAKYMVASEELEPGFGWNYSWLNALNDNPSADFSEIGKVIVDKFISVCNDYEMDGTLSVIDLSKINGVVNAVDNLSSATNGDIRAGKKQLKVFAKHQNNVRFFGDTGDEESFDVADIGSYAECFEDIHPQQSEAVKNALKEAVIYNKHSETVNTSSGLTVYIPNNALGEIAEYCTDAFREFGIMGNHTKLIAGISKKFKNPRVAGDGHNGYNRAITKQIPEKEGDGFMVQLSPEQAESVAKARFVLWRQLEDKSDYFVRLAVMDGIDVPDNGILKAPFDGYWVTYGGQPFALRERDRNEKDKVVTYTAPAYLNDKKVSLVIRVDSKNKDGRILYAISLDGPKDSHMAAKNNIKLKKGDKLVPRYWANLFLKNPDDLAKYNGETHKWVKGKEVTVGDDLQMKAEPVGSELYLLNFWLTDTDGNDFYTKGLEVRY